MVKVKLIEKRVKSHVGSVIVANVISQKRKPGMMLRRKYVQCPTVAIIDDVPLTFVDWGVEAATALRVWDNLK